MKHTLIVHKWDPDRARARQPMEIIGRHEVEGPDVKVGKHTVTGDVDGAKRAASTELSRLYPGRRVRSLSPMKGGGFSAVIADPGA